MPKLYYTPTSCSASSFISAFTGSVQLECEQVNIQNHTTASGADFYSINPKGNVPCLVFEDGMILNENAAVLQWIGDHATGITQMRICPPNGTYDRYLLQNCLNYVCSEVHASFAPLFVQHPEPIKHYLIQKANTKLTYLEKTLIADKPFLVGDTPTIVDFYLFIVLTWCPNLGLDLSSFPKTKLYMTNIANLPFVKEARERMATNPTAILDSTFASTSTFGEKMSAMGQHIKEGMKPAAEKISESMGKVTDKLTGSQPANIADSENKKPINT